MRPKAGLDADLRSARARDSPRGARLDSPAGEIHLCAATFGSLLLVLVCVLLATATTAHSERAWVLWSEQELLSPIKSFEACRATVGVRESRRLHNVAQRRSDSLMPRPCSFPGVKIVRTDR